MKWLMLLSLMACTQPLGAEPVVTALQIGDTSVTDFHSVAYHDRIDVYFTLGQHQGHLQLDRLSHAIDHSAVGVLRVNQQHPVEVRFRAPYDPTSTAPGLTEDGQELVFEGNDVEGMIKVEIPWHC